MIIKHIKLFVQQSLSCNKIHKSEQFDGVNDEYVTLLVYQYMK